MSGHTPKPWYPGRTIGEGRECIVGDGDTVVCLMPDKTTGCTLKREDAWLIASAPEMLDMLIRCRKEFAGLPHSPGYEFTHLQRLDALIAKAKGDAK